MPCGDATLHEQDGQWVVRLEGHEGRFQLYHCATRAQAERLCALFQQPLRRAATGSSEAPQRGRPLGWSWFANRTGAPH